MFTGIITDWFTNEREKLAEIEEDKKINCFICGKTWDEIEKEEENFDEHTDKLHFIWNYVFFIDFIKWKAELAPDALTTIEI